MGSIPTDSTMIYINNKTGKRYKTIEKAINCTNSNDGQEMIVYQSEHGGGWFVRESKEFKEKFTKEPNEGVDHISFTVCTNR